MSWENEYKSKLTTAEKAVELIKSGNRVVIGHACAEPSYLVDAMVANAESYHDVEIVHMVAMGKAGYAQPGMESHFRHNALFVGGTTRKAVAEGRGDYTPCFFYRIPSLFTNGSLPVDVALVQATPPDENGNMSLGISIDYTLPAARAAKSVIVQVNHELREPAVTAASMYQIRISLRSWSMMPRSLNSLRRRSAMWSAPSAQTAHP